MAKVNNKWVRTFGFDETFKYITGAYKSLHVKVRTCLNKYALKITAEAKEMCPSFQGQLRASIHPEPIGYLTRWIGSNLDYATSVEFGSDKHDVSAQEIYSENGALYKWVEKHFGGTGHEIKQQTYALGRHIQNFGTKGQGFMKQAFMNSAPLFKAEIQAITGKFGKII